MFALYKTNLKPKFLNIEKFTLKMQHYNFSAKDV